MRTITECYWHGYRASQDRVCHRTVHKGKSPYAAISNVRFTDGTTMSVSHREAKPRERVKELHGYDSLLRDLIREGLKGFVSVEELYRRRNAAKPLVAPDKQCQPTGDVSATA